MIRDPGSAKQRSTLQRIRDDAIAFAFFCLAASCAQEAPQAPAFHANENPGRLSDWGMIAATDDALHINDGVTPYDLATPLFSDYALKFRTVWTPDNAPAQYHESQSFDFSVGTVITKTFYYQQAGDDWNNIVTTEPGPEIADGSLSLDGVHLIETRVLVRREAGWDALPYVWNEEQTDAVLKRTGDVKHLSLVRSEDEMEEFAYLVPNANQCAGCHATGSRTKAIQPIGMKARHLNKPSSFQPAFNQLDHWLAAGLLEGDIETPAPKNATWTDEIAPLEARARAYLDINCSHCHNPNGPADTSGLNLEPDALAAALGVCKPPIAAGGGTGGRRFDIVPGAPDDSITVYRMETTNPAAMMPELGRALSHKEGVALIATWIAAMDGACG